MKIRSKKIKIVLIFSLFFGLLSSVFAGGVGGNGGGPSATKVKYEEAYVCNEGESGTMCRWIRFRIRKKSTQKNFEQCWFDSGEAGNLPCTIDIDKVETEL